jgi:hypothetical protein
MLIEFRVGNFRSFKDPITFSMVAANIAAADKSLDEQNVATIDDELTLLRSAAIYGANGSGKSNFALAIKFVRSFVVRFKETQIGEEIKVENFRLSDETRGKPSSFEVVFILEGIKYRYGFEVDKEQVHAEWLFHVPKTKEAKLFERTGVNIIPSKTFKEARGLEDKTRNNALFLSVLAQFNGPIARKILKWFQYLNVITGLSDNGYRRYTVACLQDDLHTEEILSFIKELDLGFDNILVEAPDIRIANESHIHESEVETGDLSDDPTVSRQNRFSIPRRGRGQLITVHRSFDEQGHPSSFESFDIDKNESEGTRKLIYLAGPLIDTLKHGKVLFIDEFDARLHPLITHQIISLFNSNVTNPNNAQLIFATHDTNLLSNRLFRRDQIWFAEKDKLGATHLFSLVEYKVRNDASFEKDYIGGKYGAIPFIGDFAQLLGHGDGK